MPRICLRSLFVLLIFLFKATYAGALIIGGTNGIPAVLSNVSNMDGVAVNANYGPVYARAYFLNTINGIAGLIHQIVIYDYHKTDLTFTYVATLSVPDDTTSPGASVASPYHFAGARGLAFATEGSEKVLYAVTSVSDGLHAGTYTSRLWRLKLNGINSITPSVVDLNQDVFYLHDTEVFAVAYNQNTHKVFISHDRTGLSSNVSVQRKRGLLQFKVYKQDCTGLAWVYTSYNCAYSFALEGSDQLERRKIPDSGLGGFSALGMTIFDYDGHSYIFETVETRNSEDQAGVEYIAAADPATGRLLFQFAMPPVDPNAASFDSAPRHLASYGDNLWVGEKLDNGSDRIVFVNVKQNPYEKSTGVRKPRTMIEKASSNIAGGCVSNCGDVKLRFGRPHDFNTSGGNQDVEVSSERLIEQTYLHGTQTLTHGRGDISTASYSVGGDTSRSTQSIKEIHWPSADASNYDLTATYEVNVWTRQNKAFVYPHLVVDDRATFFPAGSAFASTTYVDDAQAFKFGSYDATLYTPLKERIVEYIETKYEGVTADMTSSPYWVARNVQEYLRFAFNYSLENAPAFNPISAYESENGPGVFKLGQLVGFGAGDTYTNILDPSTYSLGSYPNVVMCQSSSAAYVAMMRYLGFPARSIGTSQGIEGSFIDENNDGIFNIGEPQAGTHGHMPSEVWMGESYGWLRIEQTPSSPGDTDGDGDEDTEYDYDKLHDADSQWTLIDRLGVPQNHAISASYSMGHTPYMFSNTAINAAGCETTGTCFGSDQYLTSSDLGDPSKRNVDTSAVVYDFDADTGDSESGQLVFTASLGFDVTVTGNSGVASKSLTFTPVGNWDWFMSAAPDAQLQICQREESDGSVNCFQTVATFDWNNPNVLPITVPNVASNSARILVRLKAPYETFLGGASAPFNP